MLAQNLISSINRTLRHNYPLGSDDVTFKAKFAGDLSVKHRAHGSQSLCQVPAGLCHNTNPLISLDLRRYVGLRADPHKSQNIHFF